jgi:DNA-3-methyladenine glycosylase II
MSPRIDTQADLEDAMKRLLQADPRLWPVFELTGMPPLRRRSGGLAGLASIVVSQQVSVASAAAIWARLEAALDPFDHVSVARARPDRLRRVGLSAGKIRTLKALAKAERLGHIDLAGLADHPADNAHAMLTALHGIGPWTADIYLLACLGHADAWPAGDLALQEAYRSAFALEVRPTTKEMAPLAELWRPWRGVAARLLWSYYKAVKGRDAAPLPSTSLSPAATSPTTPKRRS